MKRLRVFLFSFVLIYFASVHVFAAMDPVEINELNNKAPLHISGIVTDDVLVEDITEGDHHRQLRKMTINISDHIRVPSDLAEIESIDVYYMYIPSWQVDLYDGGKRMDIAIHDHVELWLEKEEIGWEPVLSGDSVRHLSYANERPEPIPEPFLHLSQRIITDAIKEHTNLLIFFGLFVVIGSAILYGLRKYKK